MATTEDFTRTIFPGTLPGELFGRQTPVPVFCRIEFVDGNLSITGVEGPLPSGNATGSAGQIQGGYAHRDPADNDARTSDPIPADAFTFASGWTSDRWLRFLDVWKTWHMNDAQAGCEHQRAEGWDRRPIDPAKPTTAYGRHFEGQRQDSWNLLTWVRPDEHPDGLLTKPCPVCGYKYGTAWKRQDVPADVVRFLSMLPVASRQPAWS